MWPVNDSQWRYIESLNVLTLETLSLKDNLEISDLTLVAIEKARRHFKTYQFRRLQWT